jgi:Protein of unknown function (DUF3455)
MTKRFAIFTYDLVSYLAIGAIVFALGSSAAMAQQLPPVPPKLEVPAGHSLYFKAHAVGTQNYVCLPAATGFAWKLVGPDATLFQTLFGITQQAATHFLSPNPDENGVPRATWQLSLDTSRVWARMIESSTDPVYVAPGAIPWFLLEKMGTQSGPAGGSFLTQTAYIQRLNTAGGVAPLLGCSLPSDVGAFALVPYEADYFFYKANRPK